MSTRLYTSLITLLFFLAPRASSAQDTICVYFDTINIEQVSLEPAVYRIPVFMTNVNDVSGINFDFRLAGEGPPEALDFAFNEEIDSDLNSTDIQEDGLLVLYGFSPAANVFSWPADQPIGFLTVSADLINNPLSISVVNLRAITTIANPPFIPIKGIDVAGALFDPIREVTGVVRSPTGAVAPGITVSLQTPDSLLTATTGEDGSYQFSTPVVPGGHVLSVLGPAQPSVRADRLEGVNVMDIDLIYRHAAGTRVITDTIALIAADVNEDGIVDIADGELIRDYTFLHVDEFPGAPYFHFFTAEEQPRSIVLFENGIPVDQEIDFVVLKKGDVNFSAQ
jgi:hypothetical protein